MRSVNNRVETINAAATAIVSAETRDQPTTYSKRGWGSREYHLYRNNIHRIFDDLGLAWEYFYLLDFHSIFIC
nr:hypothetical protein CFP56_43443 [Quercus suber]